MVVVVVAGTGMVAVVVLVVRMHQICMRSCLNGLQDRFRSEVPVRARTSKLRMCSSSDE